MVKLSLRQNRWWKLFLTIKYKTDKKYKYKVTFFWFIKYSSTIHNSLFDNEIIEWERTIKIWDICDLCFQNTWNVIGTPVIKWCHDNKEKYSIKH